MEAIAALAYPDWPELVPLIEYIQKEDPAQRVRNAARDFLTYQE
ncbi:MAG: hypothetical protein OEZ39_05630 [Gammaproteobacteria bacterium]|nr:hypothetical protein [Gammaproteobacteria bacterium]